MRYLNRHPALSYWFCRFPGGCGQSPRTDEGTRESFAELELALARLDREPAIEPSLLARTIAPFLVDPSGNPHRSELNVEKLWNELLPGRGRLGLVEFRAFGMARSAEVLAARACLLRALAAMLARVERLVDASTVRLQLTLRVGDGARHSLHAWRVGAEGYALRLQDEHDARGPLKLGAVRYRTFAPGVGLHPSIAALPQLRLTLQRAATADGLEVVVHGWRPDGEAYDGLPADLEVAATRRCERVVARRKILETPLLPPPTAATTAWALDLRAA